MTKPRQPTAEPTAEPSATEAAVEVVRHLHEIEAMWSRKATDARAALTDRRRTAGDEILGAALAGDGVKKGRALAAEVATLEAELDLMSSTILAARTRRIEAIPLIYKAEAAELLAKAAVLRAEAAERTPKTQALLVALKAWEGIEYSPATPPQPERPASVGAGGGAMLMVRRVPKTKLLQLEAEALEQQAATLEARGVHLDGSVYGDSVENLLELAWADPMVLAPATADVLAWADAATAKVRRRAAEANEMGGSHSDGAAPPDARLKFACTWRKGRVSADESSVSIVLQDQVPA